MMKAVWYEKQGPAKEVLTFGEMETPTPKEGEVLVRLRASGVNPSDVKARAGLRPGGMPFPKIIPQSDGAGEIEAVGEGVERSRVGERVWIWNGQWKRPFGTCAEYIALPAAQAVPLPEGTGFEEGACFGIPALTACHAVCCDGPLEGKRVLVTGGAGAVGHYAVQMAKLSGAEVFTTISNAEKAAYAQYAGADHCINYREEDVAAAVLEKTGGKGVDRIVEVEFGENLAGTLKMIAPGGVIAAYGSAKKLDPVLPFNEFLFKNLTLHTLIVYLLDEKTRGAAIERLHGWLKEGALKHSVAASYPLKEAASAHELVESAQKMGSVLVTP
jgi:NADPH2:quinone reductase